MSQVNHFLPIFPSSRFENVSHQKKQPIETNDSLLSQTETKKKNRPPKFDRGFNAQAKERKNQIESTLHKKNIESSPASNNPLILLHNILKEMRDVFRTISKDEKNQIKAHKKRWNDTAETRSGISKNLSKELRKSGRYQCMVAPSSLVAIQFMGIAARHVLDGKCNGLLTKAFAGPMLQAQGGLQGVDQRAIIEEASKKFHGLLDQLSSTFSNALSTGINQMTQAEERKAESKSLPLDQQLASCSPEKQDLDQMKNNTQEQINKLEQTISQILSQYARLYGI